MNFTTTSSAFRSEKKQKSFASRGKTGIANNLMVSVEKMLPVTVGGGACEGERKWNDEKLHISVDRNLFYFLSNVPNYTINQRRKKRNAVIKS